MEFLGVWNQACSSMGLACRIGNYTLLKSLLKAGRTVDVQDNRGWRPIHEAVAGHHVDCLKLLLEQESNDINWRSFEGQTPLLLAARNGDDEIVRILLKHGGNPNLSNNEEESPLYLATMCHSLACVKLLVKAGADVNHSDFSSDSPLHAAVTISDLPITAFLLDHGAKLDCRNNYGMTPIFTAAYYGSLECLKFLLCKANDAGMNWLVDTAAEDHATPLMLAAQCGHFECVELLLENGADPNKRADRDALALHMAVEKGHLECVKLLLSKTERSALLLSENNISPVSAVHLAVAHERHEILNHLLEEGLSANACLDNVHWPVYKNDRGMCLLNFIHICGIKKPYLISALGVAVAMHSLESISILLNAGCDVDPEPQIVSPLTVAAFQGYIDIVGILLSRGANPNFPEVTPALYAHPLIAATYAMNPQCLRLLLKVGGDPRRCFSVGSNSCWTFLVESLDWNNYSEIAKVIAVYQEFLGHRLITDYLSKFHVKMMDEYVPEGHNWRFYLKSDVSYSLAHQCRLKIRECIMDNGFKVPLSMQLSHLPVPDRILQYLKFEF